MKKRTIENPGRRATETGNYVQAAYTPGGCTRFGAGTKAALRLRLLHSGIRVSALDSGRWNEADFGAPASIMDTIGGALPHTWWAMTAAQSAGYRFTDREKCAVAEFAACAMFLSLRSASGFAAPEATATLLPSMTHIELDWLPTILQPAVVGAFNAYGHRVLGDGLCKATGIPDSPMKYVIKAVNGFVTVEDQVRRPVAPVNWLHGMVMHWLWSVYLKNVTALAFSAERYHTLGQAS